MPEGVGYGPQNTASTGLNLNIIGDHAYAYSGALVLAADLSDWLNFTTGAEIIVAKVQINADWSGIAGNTLYNQIYLNGELVIYERDTGNDYVPGAPVIHFIIPPLTKFQLQMKAAAATYASATLTGRVYK